MKFKFSIINKTQVIAITVALSFVIALTGYIYFKHKANDIRQNKYEDLKAIADLKESQIVNWIKERKADARVISQSLFFVETIENWLENKNNLPLKQEIIQRLIPVNNEYEYENIFLTSAKGELLLSTNDSLNNFDQFPIDKIMEAVTKQELIVTDLYYCSTHNKVHYDIIAPLINKDKKVIGTLVFRRDPNRFLYPLVQSWPTPGKSSETAILRVENDSVVFLNELRHMKNTALKLKIPLTRTEVPAVQAALGRSGMFEGRDYRGVKVLSDIRIIGENNWIMLAKTDKSEIYSGLYLSAVIIAGFSLLLILICVFSLAYIFNSRQKNIFKDLYNKEKELWQQQERFRVIMDSLGDGVITLDLNGKVQYMNKIAEELTGWSLRKAKGRNLGEIYPVKNEETGEKENNILDKVLKHGIVKELANHTILISNNGREIPVMDTGAPVFDIDGTVTGIVLTFGDETEKRTQQKLLKESEARLNEAQRIALLGNWELNLNNNRLYWSDEIYRIFEIDKHAFGATYEAFLNSIHPEDRDYVNKAYSDSLRNKLPYAIEHRLLMQDGRIKFVLEQCVTFFDETGNPVRSVGTVQDITERKLAEERYRNTLDNMLEGCHIIGFDWRYLYLNNAADVHNRRPKEELLGRKYTDIWPGTESTEVYGILKHCMDERVPHYTENEFLFPDGTKGWFELSIQPVQEGIFILSQDITGRKKNEEELIMAKEKAEEGDRLKTAFLHNISHEIRTPMNAIVGFSALLNEPNIDSSNRHLYTELIMNGSYQLLSIITDIIDISNIEANTVKVTTSEINLNSIIRSLHEQFLLKANEKNITIVSEPGLPDEDSIIQTDKTKLIQIISNLLNNALKFTWQGQIKFGYGVKDNMIEFYVSDTGLGIPEEYHKKIFERFYQVEDPVEKLNEGIGVGLTICRAYVELLGGEIRLVSTPEVGSTFYFTLPIEKPGDMLLTTTSPMKEISFVFPEKKKILIAEDIESNFKLICHFLSGANADVIRASNGKEAVEKCLSDQSIDLVLMDIRMPVMSGYAATELIRLSKPDIPIIAQTAYGDDRERAIKCGCSGIISKPFDKKHLLQTIQQFI